MNLSDPYPVILASSLLSLCVRKCVFSRPGGHSKKENVQLLLCADFNSLPESGVIEFINNGKVAVNHPEFKEQSPSMALHLLFFAIIQTVVVSPVDP
jgi:hypothetical protein